MSKPQLTDQACPHCLAPTGGGNSDIGYNPEHPYQFMEKAVLSPAAPRVESSRNRASEPVLRGEIEICTHDQKFEKS